MKLTKKEKRFIQQNWRTLRAIIDKRIDELKDDIIDMEAGDKRDVMIALVQEYKNFWKHQVDSLKPESENKDEDDLFI